MRGITGHVKPSYLHFYIYFIVLYIGKAVKGRLFQYYMLTFFTTYIFISYKYWKF